MLTPELHVGGVGDEYVAEGCVAVIGRTRKHREFAVDLLGEEDAVAVERKEGILALIELLEIKGIGDTDCRAVATVAEGYPVAVAAPGDAGIILIVGTKHIGVACLELYRGIAYFPVDAILRESGIYVHLNGTVVAAEHSCEAVTEWDNRRIEYRIGNARGVSVDHRVVFIAPHYIAAVVGSLLPRY